MASMDIDDLVNDANEREARHGGRPDGEAGNDIDGIAEDAIVVENANRQRIGTVEHFFTRVGVAAIKLEAELSVGDYIEIDTGNGSVSERVSSMQIDREDIQRARAGDSVGIKISRQVPSGSTVYKSTEID